MLHPCDHVRARCARAPPVNMTTMTERDFKGIVHFQECDYLPVESQKTRQNKFASQVPRCFKSTFQVWFKQVYVRFKYVSSVRFKYVSSMRFKYVSSTSYGFHMFPVFFVRTSPSSTM